MQLDDIKAALGRPAYEDETLLLYHGDALELMDLLPAECVDQIVTSPPYNIGKAYESHMTTEKYRDWMADWIAKSYRLAKPAGSLWLNLGYVRPARPANSSCESDCVIRSSRIRLPSAIRPLFDMSEAHQV
ncbi:hypothetical protein H8A95_04460 [Bradyrhizobium sp. Pear76]|uniref:DNA methyltransferase n=1 Tax=Bradyrhizobium oropedii TaxID=1571201 RepID=UPI001E2F32BC|nr:DNA methyltransferase [Bradyrhizobium oropedii]MCC8961593.1 hypothetical protein [Bradyrhizobium oropedii]